MVAFWSLYFWCWQTTFVHFSASEPLFKLNMIWIHGWKHLGSTQTASRLDYSSDCGFQLHGWRKRPFLQFIAFCPTVLFAHVLPNILWQPKAAMELPETLCLQ